MTDHLDAPPELMPLEACDCCGVPSSYLRGHGEHRICLACFFIWYDDGLVAAAEIKALRLKRCGSVDVGRDGRKYWNIGE
jgi:hypothetical protein